jgi:2'-5' RNA ligase
METVRSFVSMNVPSTPAVHDVRERLKGIGGISVPDEVHMTLRFLGDVDKEKIEELSERMRSLERYSCFNVSMKGLGAFPDVRNPRVVWIGADLGPPFHKILSELDGILDRTSVEYDKKPFKAHVTVGRVRGPSGPLTGLLREHRDLDAGSFICSEILLMSSLLTPYGAKHSVIGAFRLGGPLI